MNLIMLILIGASIANPATEPPSDSDVAAFISALPPPEIGTARTPKDQKRIAELRALNPGRDQAIESIFVQHEQCRTSARNDQQIGMMREIAQRLNKDQLVSMTAFYRSGDYFRKKHLNDKVSDEVELTRSEQLELNAFFSKYPITDFGLIFIDSFWEYAELGDKRYEDCSNEMSVAFGKAGLKE